MSSAEAIAKAFRARVEAGGLADSQAYHSVQSGCIALLASASSSAKVSLFCAAALAERLAREVEDEAILAESEGDWHAYADALERVIRLSGSTAGAQETLWSIANAIAKIMPPRGISSEP